MLMPNSKPHANASTVQEGPPAPSGCQVSDTPCRPVDTPPHRRVLSDAQAHIVEAAADIRAWADLIGIYDPFTGAPDLLDMEDPVQALDELIRTTEDPQRLADAAQAVAHLRGLSELLRTLAVHAAWHLEEAGAVIPNINVPNKAVKVMRDVQRITTWDEAHRLLGWEVDRPPGELGEIPADWPGFELIPHPQARRPRADRSGWETPSGPELECDDTDGDADGLTSCEGPVGGEEAQEDPQDNDCDADGDCDDKTTLPTKRQQARADLLAIMDRGYWALDTWFGNAHRATPIVPGTPSFLDTEASTRLLLDIETDEDRALRERREELGLHQREVGVRATSSKMAISRLERGESGSHLDTLTRILRALNCTGVLLIIPDEEVPR